MTLYFPHIPKCGGTSIKKIFEMPGINSFMDYEHPPNHLKYFHDLSEIRNKEFSKLNFDVFDVVYGHYPIKRYNHSGNVILLLRHPVERAISHFNFYKYVMPETNLIAIGRNPSIKLIKSGECNFVSFLKSDKMNSFYERFLEGLEIDDVREVFFTERMDELFQFLAGHFGLNVSEITSKERENKVFKEALSEAEMSFVEEFLSDEIKIYQKFGGDA